MRRNLIFERSNISRVTKVYINNSNVHTGYDVGHMFFIELIKIKNEVGYRLHYIPDGNTGTIILSSKDVEEVLMKKWCS